MEDSQGEGQSEEDPFIQEVHALRAEWGSLFEQRMDRVNHFLGQHIDHQLTPSHQRNAPLGACRNTYVNAR